MPVQNAVYITCMLHATSIHATRLVGSCDMPIYRMCTQHTCGFACYVHVELTCILKCHAVYVHGRYEYVTCMYGG